MIFIFLITIVFVAEIIIMFSICFQLLKIDKKLIEINGFLDKAKPKIKEILELMHGISAQIVELTPIWVQKLTEKRDEIILRILKRVMSDILLLSINIKIINKIRKSKIVKAAWKGLTLLQNVI